MAIKFRGGTAFDTTTGQVLDEVDLVNVPLDDEGTTLAGLIAGAAAGGGA